MIPCFSMRLEIEVPDPKSNYFVLDRDQLDSGKVIAPAWVDNLPTELNPRTRGDNHDDGPYKWGYWGKQNYNYEKLIVADRCGEDPVRTWGEVKNGDVCDDIIPIPDDDDDPRVGYIWTDVISNATDITIERGFDVRQSVVGRPEVGTLVANILNPTLQALDAGTATIGSRLRLRVYDYHNEVWNKIFVGTTERIAVTDTAGDEASVQIFGVDVLARLNGVLIRDGRPAETYESRMAFSADQVAGLRYTIEDGEEQNAIRLPLTALELLHQAQDSEGSVAFVDRTGHLYATNREWNASSIARFPVAAQFAFTNNVSGDLLQSKRVEEEVICLSGWRQTNDTADVINGVTFTNYEDVLENEGEDDEEIVSKGTNYPFYQGNSAQLYGSSSVRLTTYLDPVTLPNYAETIFDEFSQPRTKVEGIEFPADTYGSLDFPESILMDVGDQVRVLLKDPARPQNIMTDSVQRVAKIKHQITPQEWLVQAELL